MSSFNNPQLTRQTTANNADASHALQGALRAFTRPAYHRSTSSSTSARTLNGVYYVPAGSEDGRAINHEATRAAYTMTPDHNVRVEPPHSMSPSTYAAMAAAARTKTAPLPPRTRVPVQPPRLQEPSPSRDDVQADVLPSEGTVDTLKAKFQKLDAAASTRNVPAAAPAAEILDSTSSGGETPITDGRPRLGLDTSLARATAGKTSTEIHSPKPVRIRSVVPPIEAVVIGSTPSTPGHALVESRRPVSRVDTGEPSKPAIPPPRGTLRARPLRAATSQTLVPTVQKETIEPFALLRSNTVRQAPEFRTPQIPKRGQNPGLNIGELDARRVDSLANAIVGAHLASSRMSSPAKSDVLSPEWLTKPRPPLSRTPSPRKTMRQTLRDPPAPVKEDKEKAWHRERSHFHLRKHPNKHHEGNRKRWRDEITENERKRYEGVWAANRDIFVNLTDEELQSPGAAEKAKSYVSGLVVRDIWSRSRLTPHDLEEIWNLVDKEGLPRISRESFVVGMWLIDQRLKGRKLPVKVGDSVWHSVRGVYGLKVPKLKDRLST